MKRHLIQIALFGVLWGVILGKGSVQAGQLTWQFAEITNSNATISAGALLTPALDHGRVAFSTEGSGVFPAPPLFVPPGVLTDVSGSLQAVADITTSIPGGIGTFTEVFGRAPSLDHGQVAFFGAGTANQQGIYKGMRGSLEVVADTTTPIPTSVALPPLGTFTGFTNFPSLDGHNVAFGGFGPNIGSPPRPLRGIYLNRAGSVEVVADIFTPVPGHPQDTFSVFDLSPSLHNGGVAFHAEDSAGRTGIYTSIGGNLALVADTTTPIPGSTGIFNGFGAFPSINHNNVAFAGDGGIYLSIAGTRRTLTKVFDASNLSSTQRFIDVDLFHEALSDNSIAFVADIHDETLSTTVAKIFRADLVGVTFPDFSDSALLMLNGTAQQAGAVLQLTADEPSQAGSIFFPVPFTVSPTSSFQAQFVFRIGGVNDGGPLGSDGLAFVIHNDPRKAAALGNAGEGLGFGINDTAGNPMAPITPSVAIEFDTHQNAFPLRPSADPNDNHVALILNGNVSDHRAVSSPVLLLNNGDPRFVWVNYSGPTKRLEVFLSDVAVKPAAPLFSTTLDLASVVGEEAFFGFTAATGQGFNSHEVLSWELTVNPFAEPGDLDGDGDVDTNDLNILLRDRNKAVSASSCGAACDLDGDERITVLDARKLTLLCTRPRCASGFTLRPTVGFSSRVTSGHNVIIGSGDLGSLFIKKGTEDRTLLEFDLSGAATSVGPIYLNFYLRNIDRPAFSPLSLYAYTGDGLVAASDFFRTDTFITSFTDFGLLPENFDPLKCSQGIVPIGCEFKAFSLDVTNIYNTFVTTGRRFLGFLLLADTTAARYDLNKGGADSSLALAIALSNQKLPPLPVP